MFAVSAVMLIVAAWRCGPTPTLLAAVGVGLLFVGMYVLPDDMRTGGTAMSTAGSNTSPAAVSFYLGLAAVTGSLVWSARRRRLRRCRPVAVLPELRQSARS